MSKERAERSMEEVIDFVLRRNADVLTCGWSALDQMDPAQALMAAEEMEEEERREQREWMLGRLLDYFFAGGPDPLEVIRKVFATVAAVRPDLLGNMRYEDIALLCGDGLEWDEKLQCYTGNRATVAARIERVYGRVLRKAGMKATRAAGQKGQAARESFSKAQQGNRNRTKNRKPRRRKKR